MEPFNTPEIIEKLLLILSHLTSQSWLLEKVKYVPTKEDFLKIIMIADLNPQDFPKICTAGSVYLMP